MATVKVRRRRPREPNAACIGSHLSIAGGMHHAIEAALQLGFDTVQVFVKNQRQWRASPLNSGDVDRWRMLLRTPGFGPVAAHATYLINLATADPELRDRSCAGFGEELDRCAALEIPYLVVHPGSAGDGPRAEAMQRVAAALDSILEQRLSSRVMPLLETTAGQGASLGRFVEELGFILRSMRHAGRVGVCVDTCHVFAAGYDIRHPAEYERLVSLLDAEVGLERIRCWHLNDSVGECGSRRDRHAHIGYGRIGVPGFRNVLGDARFRGIPMILETPKELDERGRDWDSVNLARLRRIDAQSQRA